MTACCPSLLAALRPGAIAPPPGTNSLGDGRPGSPARGRVHGTTAVLTPWLQLPDDRVRVRGHCRSPTRLHRLAAWRLRRRRYRAEQADGCRRDCYHRRAITRAVADRDAPDARLRTHLSRRYQT